MARNNSFYPPSLFQEPSVTVPDSFDEYFQADPSLKDSLVTAYTAWIQSIRQHKSQQRKQQSAKRKREALAQRSKLTRIHQFQDQARTMAQSLPSTPTSHQSQAEMTEMVHAHEGKTEEAEPSVSVPSQTPADVAKLLSDYTLSLPSSSKHLPDSTLLSVISTKLSNISRQQHNGQSSSSSYRSSPRAFDGEAALAIAILFEEAGKHEANQHPLDPNATPTVGHDADGSDTPSSTSSHLPSEI